MTVKVPALPVHDNVEVWLAPRTMLVGVRVQVNPVEGEIALVRETVPVNAFTGATVMVEVAAAPAVAVTAVGLAVTLKSGTSVTV